MTSRLPRLYAPVSVAGVRGGTPLTLDGAFEVLDTLASRQAAIERSYYHALARYEAVKTPLAKTRWRNRLEEYRPEFVKIERAVERLQNQIDDYGDALVEREKEEEGEEEDSAEEWQFGLEYEAEHRMGKGRPEDSNVDFNVDIRRRDGKPITKSEAKEALRYRIENGVFASQYEFAMINYRSPNSNSARAKAWGNHTHSVDELDSSFDAIFLSTNINDWRAGGIEE